MQIGFGLVVMFGGTELLIRGTAGLAVATGRPGPKSLPRALLLLTYAPALFFSTQAAATGSPELALAGVLGGASACLLLLPGIAALTRPLALPDAANRRRHGWIIPSAALLLAVFAMDGLLSSDEGLMLLIALGAYFFTHVRPAPLAGEDLSDRAKIAQVKQCLYCAAAYVLVGLGLLFTGTDVAVDGILGLARQTSSSEALMGIALAGCLSVLYPLYAALAEGWRKKEDIQLDMFFHGAAILLLGAAGLAATVNAIPMAERLSGPALWLPALLALWPLAVKRTRFGSREGLFLVALYVVYVLTHYLSGI